MAMVSSTPAGSGLPIGLMPGALPSDHASRQTLQTTAMRLPLCQTQVGCFFIRCSAGECHPHRTGTVGHNVKSYPGSPRRDCRGWVNLPRIGQHALRGRGLMDQAPARTMSAINAGAMASHRLAAATAAAAAQPIDEKASVKVATREETWRRRN